ncbi:hypothetical protein K474DRAFT_1711614 [Panus rudis PR-1116 ss-1]|nr:hypothetical protein K474DRAFT_1711614 [Panus rudis PR-1116 ss-1]
MRTAEIVLFLKLATALKILLSSSISEKQLQRADELLKEYLLQFRELYGEDAMKPNHHWAIHTPLQIRDYGPVYNFWAFLMERLNKILKNFNLNNWDGGRLEISMMRAFSCDTKLKSMLGSVARSNSDSVNLSAENSEQNAKTVTNLVARRLLQESNECRGTVESIQGTGSYRSDAAEDALVAFPILLGPLTSSTSLLSDRSRKALFEHYNRSAQVIYFPSDSCAPRGAIFLNSNAIFHRHFLLDGRRITPVSTSIKSSASSAIVQTRIAGEMHVGEVLSVFQHSQRGTSTESTPSIFVEMRWMKRRLESPVEDDPWSDYPELEVEFWEFNKFYAPDELGAPPIVIEASTIVCQVARGVCTISKPKLWATTSLNHHSISCTVFEEAA